MRVRYGRLARAGAAASLYVPLLLACLAAAGCAGAETPVAPTGPAAPGVPVASPPLPEAPIPTAGARVRVVNTGRYAIDSLSLVFPREELRIGNLPVDGTSGYVTSVHGVYEGPVFRFFLGGDVAMGPGRPEVALPPPAPLGGYAFTFYVEIAGVDGPEMTQSFHVRIARITRDE